MNLNGEEVQRSTPSAPKETPHGVHHQREKGNRPTAARPLAGDAPDGGEGRETWGKSREATTLGYLPESPAGAAQEVLARSVLLLDRVVLRNIALGVLSNYR